MIRLGYSKFVKPQYIIKMHLTFESDVLKLTQFYSTVDSSSTLTKILSNASFLFLKIIKSGKNVFFFFNDQLKGSNAF